MELVLVTGIFAVVSVFLLRIYLTADHLRGEAVAISTATVRAQGVAEAVKRARSGEGPAFIECSTYRYRNHYESADSEDFWYRTKEEWEEWNNRCPIRKIEEKIRNESINMKDQLDKIDQELKEEIENAFLFAKRSPYPNSLYDFG